MTLRIISRKEWGAKDSLGEIPLRTPVPQVLHTYTDTAPCRTQEECTKAVKALQEEHMEDDLPDIKYNFVIGGDGNVYEGRGWTQLPDLHGGYKELWETSIEVSHIGRKGIPSQMIMELAEKLLKYGVSYKYIKMGFEYHMHFDDVDDDDDYEPDEFLKYANERTNDKASRIGEKKIIKFTK